MPSHLKKSVSAQDYPREYSSTAWSPDGTMIAMSGNYGSVQVFDTDGNMLFDLVGHYPESFVDAVAWSPDSSRLVSGGTDRDIHVWYIQPPAGQTSTHTPGELLATMRGHRDRIYDLAWSPDGTKILSVSYFDIRNLRIWDANTYRILIEKIAPNIGDVVWSPDGSKFLFGAESGAYVIEYSDIEQSAADARIFDYSTLLTGPDFIAVSSVDWKQYGTTEYIAVGMENEIRIYDPTSLSLVDTINVSGFPLALTWSRDLSLIASVNKDTNHLEVWDVSTGTLAGAFTQDKISITTSIAWSPNDSQIAYGDNTLEIVDTSCLVAPGDGSVPVMMMPCETVDDTIWPTYSWWAADGADWYQLYVANTTSTIRPFGSGGGGMWVEAAQVCNGDICEFRPVDGLEATSPSHFGLPDDTYTWTIRSLNSIEGGMSDWQPSQGFEVINPVPTLIDPVFFGDTGWPTYTWTPVPDADWYHLWAGGQDNTTLIDIWLRTANVCDENECHYQSRLQEDYLYANQHNGLYAWYVQAHHSSTGITGAWQGTTLAITAMPPGTQIFESLTPIVDMAGRQTLTLTWHHGGFEEFYQIVVHNAAHQVVFNREWFYFDDVCVEGTCQLTVYFDGPAHHVYLGAYNASNVVTWSVAQPLTIIEPPGEMMTAGQPPDVSVLTPDSIGTDETTDEFVPPSTLEPPDIIQTYPDICGDNPLCDSPFGDE